jgi:phosphoribosylformimino-5-aminoimidazole carboxamide ribotide isomerase
MLPMFDLLPAIDLLGGQVVRLRQGDFDQATMYTSGPTSVAAGFVASGATWLHVVDLDGARAGEPRQLPLVAEVAAEVRGRGRVEVGGGLRTAASVAEALATGATRAVVGTAALRNPAFAAELVARHGSDRIAAAIDVRDGLALGEGWRAGAPGLPAAEAIAMLAATGIQTFEVTAIDRDGLMQGPDLALLRTLVDLQRGQIIASGGVSSIEDVLAARDIGCAGVIVGRALYEGGLDVLRILAALDGRPRS